MNEGQTPDRPRPTGEKPDAWIERAGLYGAAGALLSESDSAISEKIGRHMLSLYAGHLESLGLVTTEKLLAFEHRSPDYIPEHVLQLSDSAFGKGFVEACCGAPVAFLRETGF